MLHFDVMDGDFVPTFGISPPFIAAVRDRAEVPFDVHIMVRHPLRYIAPLRDAGADLITFHIESADPPDAVISAIKQQGIRCGVAFSPKTPVAAVEPYLPALDLVLPMSVEPGLGGQRFQETTLAKIGALHRSGQKLSTPPAISVDGGVTPEIAPAAIESGATVLVAGTAIFGSPHPETVIQRLRNSPT